MLGIEDVKVRETGGFRKVGELVGLGTVVISSQITQGTFISTAKQNFVLYHLTMNGDIASSFDLTTDSLGLIGINSGYSNKERGQVESLVMDGIKIFVEYAAGVVKGTINPM